MATAAGPNGEVTSTTDFHLERLSFVRDPQAVAPRHPLEGTKYFADRYRLCIPAWGLDLVSEPFVAAPAHAFPIEYWSGPTRLTGTLDGTPVSGFGFDERTRVFCLDFEIVEVLRETLRHLPAAALPAGRSDGARLANLAWEIDSFIADGDQQAAVRYLNARVRPASKRSPSPTGPTSAPSSTTPRTLCPLVGAALKSGGRRCAKFGLLERVRQKFSSCATPRIRCREPAKCRSACRRSASTRRHHGEARPLSGRAEAPGRIGYEVAGDVSAVGPGAGCSVGERVFALTRFGGYSDVVCVPASQAVSLPGSMSYEEGAAIPVNYLTAYRCSVQMGSLKRGERVLVHSAAGGVGLAAIDLAASPAQT